MEKTISLFWKKFIIIIASYELLISAVSDAYGAQTS